MTIQINLPDKRLNDRYLELVKAHAQHAPSTAAGPAIAMDTASSFAATQAAWRFFANPKVTPEALVEPLRDFAREQLVDSQYVLSVIDWSKIDYRLHEAKKDVVQLTHEYDVGYELTTQLLVCATTGNPIAPIQAHLKTANGYLTTAELAVPETHKLDQVSPLMDESLALDIKPTMVHVIDREADSLWHLRLWNKDGHLFVVRGDSDRCVTWQGESMMYHDIEAQLESQGAFESTREVTIRGQKGVQYIAETKILLDRPASHTVNKKRKMIPGEALSLRLIISKIYDPQTGELLSTWYLLTNVPPNVCAAQIALWYYWRWNIESYFKLMKSGGQQLEHWQQESGLAILKRLLVASMATATVWYFKACRAKRLSSSRRFWFV